MCSNCGSKISVLWSMTVQELLNYALANKGSPAAAHGRLDEAISVLLKNGGCGTCIGKLREVKRNIF